MQEELTSIEQNNTWDVVDLPTGKKAIGTKWVFKLKQKANGTIDRYKAQLVAKGYAQQKGIDYEETFAPTSRMTIVRSMISMATCFRWHMHQLDRMTAFLNGDLQEEVYVRQRLGFVMPWQERKVCRFKKTSYSSKHAPKAWYAKIDAYLANKSN